MANRYRNQHGLLNPDSIEETSFVVIGAGAIGSFFVSTAAKMGARKITVYDDDSIEDHNFANQLYPITQLKKPKVEALKAVTMEYGEAIIETKKMRWHPDNAVDADIIVVAVDNMDCRKAIWDHYKTRNYRFFVEGRMSAQVYRVYGVEKEIPEAIKFYETTLYPQAEAAPERCGEKSIIYCVLGVASEMLCMVKKFINDDPNRNTEIVYDFVNNTMDKKTFMEAKYEVIEAVEDVEDVPQAELGAEEAVEAVS